MYQKSTRQALALKRVLEDHHGIIVECEKYDGHKHIDLAITRARLNIEVDGRQHYEDPYQIMRDLGRMRYSQMKGFDTIHIPNVFVDSKEDLHRVANALASAATMRAEQLGHRFHYRQYEKRKNHL